MLVPLSEKFTFTAASATSGSASDSGGPGLAYMPFVVMEDLLDKLKLLNYEEVSTGYLFDY